MQYTIIITTADGKQTTHTTTAHDARTAHEHGATIAHDTAASIRVYPTTQDEHGATIAAGIARGALMVARRTAANAVRRTGGNETQCRIDKELTAANARCHGAETARRIIDVIADYSADTQDFFAIAAAGLADAVADGASIADQYHAAFLALNRHIHTQRSATAYEISTEFITDGGGDIVAINTAISAIIRGGDKWTPTDGGNMDARTAARLGMAITAALRQVSPTQRHIAELLGRGYSQRHIAELLGRGTSTINRNIAIMRGKISEYIHTSAPEFSEMIYSMTVIEATQTANVSNAGRTAAARKRKAAKNAEYCKAYRARKAAKAAEHK